MSEATRHLTAASWAALQADPASDRSLVEHVAAGCDECDQVIASQVDALDGELDRALLSLAPRAPQPLDEVGWQRLRKSLRPKAPVRRWFVAGAALAAMLSVFVARSVSTSPTSPTPASRPDGVKGSTGSQGPQLQLAAARKRSTDSFVRLDDGASLSAGSVLVFQATSTIEGPARVFLQRSSGAPLEVGVTALKAGTHELQTDTGLLGVTLDGEQGDVTVWVVVGETPFSAEAAISAIGSKGSADLGVAQVHVHVE